MQPQITTQKVEALAQISLVCEAELYERFKEDDKRRAALMLRTLIDAKDEVFDDPSGQAFLLALDVNAQVELPIEPVSDEFSPADREFDFTTPYITDELITALAVIEDQQREQLRAMALRAHHGWPYAQIAEDLQTQKTAEPRKWASDTGKEVAARLLGVALKGCGLFQRDQFPWVVLGNYAESNTKIEQVVQQCIEHEQTCDICYAQHVSVARLMRLIAAVIAPREPQLRAKAAKAEVSRETNARSNVGISPPAPGGLAGPAESPESTESLDAAAPVGAEMQDVHAGTRVAAAGGSEEQAARVAGAVGAATSSLAPPAAYEDLEKPDNDLTIEIEASALDVSKADASGAQLRSTDALAQQNFLEIDVLDDQSHVASSSHGYEGDDELDAMFFEEQDEGLDGVDQQLEELARLDVRKRVLAARQGGSEAIARSGAAEILSPDFRRDRSAFSADTKNHAGAKEPASQVAPARPLEVAYPNEPAKAESQRRKNPRQPEQLAGAQAGAKGDQREGLQPADQLKLVDQPEDDVAQIKEPEDQLADREKIKRDNTENETPCDKQRPAEGDRKHSELSETPEAQEAGQAKLISAQPQLVPQLTQQPRQKPGQKQSAAEDFDFDFSAWPAEAKSAQVGQLAERWALKSAQDAKPKPSGSVERPRGVYPAPGGDAAVVNLASAAVLPKAQVAAPIVTASVFDAESEEQEDAPGEFDAQAAQWSSDPVPAGAGLSRRRLIAGVCLILALMVSIGVIGFGGGTGESQVASAPPPAPVVAKAKAKHKKAKKKSKKKAKAPTPIKKTDPRPAENYVAPAPARPPAPVQKVGDGSSEFLPEDRG